MEEYRLCRDAATSRACCWRPASSDEAAPQADAACALSAGFCAAIFRAVNERGFRPAATPADARSRLRWRRATSEARCPRQAGPVDTRRSMHSGIRSPTVTGWRSSYRLVGDVGDSTGDRGGAWPRGTAALAALPVRRPRTARGNGERASLLRTARAHPEARPLAPGSSIGYRLPLKIDGGSDATIRQRGMRRFMTSSGKTHSSWTAPDGHDFGNCRCQWRSAGSGPGIILTSTIATTAIGPHVSRPISKATDSIRLFFPDMTIQAGTRPVLSRCSPLKPFQRVERMENIFASG